MTCFSVAFILGVLRALAAIAADDRATPLPALYFAIITTVTQRAFSAHIIPLSLGRPDPRINFRKE
jgi:hypothetical protein